MFDHYEDSLRKFGKYTIKRHNKYGFWTIHPDKGKTPRELDQYFTQADLAAKAITVYEKKKAA